MKITITQNYNKYGFYATTCYEIYTKDCNIFLGYVYSIRRGRTKWYFKNENLNVSGESYNRKSTIKDLLTVVTISIVGEMFQ